MAEIYRRLREGQVVGWDLDGTLVDSLQSILNSLVVAAREVGFTRTLDLAGARKRFGLRIEEEMPLQLPPNTPPDRVAAAIQVFREQIKEGAHTVRLFPGARRSLERVVELGGRNVILTGKLGSIATGLLNRFDLRVGTGLDVDEVVGQLSRNGKTTELRQRDVWAYIGDQPEDMTAAKEAGVPGIGVLTGNKTEALLHSAGAGLVLASVEDLPDFIGTPPATWPPVDYS